MDEREKPKVENPGSEERAGLLDSRTELLGKQNFHGAAKWEAVGWGREEWTRGAGGVCV